MHRNIVLWGCLCSILLIGCAGSEQNAGGKENGLQITLQNSASVAYTDGVVSFDLKQAGDEIGEVDWYKAGLAINGNPIPSQAIDNDGDDIPDELLMLVSVPAGQSVVVDVTPEGTRAEQQKRTHAELSVKTGGAWKDRVYEGGDFKDVDQLAVPPEHTDHSFYIRYEGPGWESEKVGYRFYLDWRNAVDIFGKTKDALVLDQVGLDGFDSYHEMSDWGMDILKVGEALGIGALGCWSGGKALRMSQTDSVYCEIPFDGDLESRVKTKYYGWSTPYGKTDVISELSIRAGERRTRHDITFGASCDSVCTGIVKHADTEVMTSDRSGWNYLATWGVQSLAEDKLGMVVFYNKDDALAISEDEFNHIVALKPPSNGKLTYYFAACWEQEENGIKTRAAFEDYLNKTVAELDNQIKCSSGGI